MSKDKKKHHYISQFYLSGFTLTGNKDDVLWVLDQKNVKQWEDKPKNIAFETGFNKIDIPGMDSDKIENDLAIFEGKVAPVLNNIVERKCLPTGDDFILLMNLVALFATNIPRQRDTISKAISDISEKMLALMLETPERWQSILDRENIDKNYLSYEEAKRFFESKKYNIEAAQNLQITSFISSIDAILPYLINRKWGIIVSDESSGEFICSDSPVALVWTEAVPSFYQNSPGFGMKNTELTIPLNKYMALVATFEDKYEGFTKADLNNVATINSRTAMYSKRFIYSANKDFPWLRKDGNVCNINDLLSELKKRK